MPSPTSVKPSVTELSVVAATVRSSTVPGGWGETMICALPLWPPLVAVMVADPGATPVTRPVPSTVATLVSLLVHVTAGARAGTLPPSGGIAVSRTASPTPTLAAGGVTSSAPVTVGDSRQAIVSAETVATSSAARRVAIRELPGRIMPGLVPILSSSHVPSVSRNNPLLKDKTTKELTGRCRAVMEVVAYLPHWQRGRATPSSVAAVRQDGHHSMSDDRHDDQQCFTWQATRPEPVRGLRLSQ